ncbi:beta strand repeat-containing protein, partial [Chelatococcus reniformis]|uniref:beta strand repeat-containing protein n=1 Tax=Chelatococcus reniformis TaxID=1494448 RepID=UPI00166DD369
MVGRPTALRTLLLGTAAWLIVPGHAAAQSVPYTFGIWQQTIGASGNPGADSAPLTVTNSNTITLNPTGLTNGAGIWASNQGGAGTSGGAGGGAGSSQGLGPGLFVQTNAAIYVTATGPLGFAGIQALSLGGAGSTGGPGNGGYPTGPNGGPMGPGGSGGFGGSVQVTNDKAVNVDWTWQNVGSTNFGVYGIQAQSQGGEGHWNTNSSGGNGGDAGAVILVYDGSIELTVTGTPPSSLPTSPSAGILMAGYGGSGGQGSASSDNANGGNGGNVQGFSLQMQGGNVKTVGDQLPGILIAGVGGAGWLSGCQYGQDCNPDQSSAHNTGGNGGSILTSATAAWALVGMPWGQTAISTAGTESPGVAVLLQGGGGGAGGSQTSFTQADGGGGGNGGYVEVTGVVVQNATVNTTGSDSPGIIIASQGGNGGNAGGAKTTTGSAYGGNGGTGGAGGDVSLELLATAISTAGANSAGILARSEGGIAGNGGFGDVGIGASGGGTGGNGGNAGNLSVSLDNASSIATQGANSFGIVLQSLSGAGGDGNGNAGDSGSGGNGGSGGTTGNLTVTNAGKITTAGAQSSGILAQTLAGAGGSGGDTGNVFHSSGGTGASGGSVGSISVSQTGAIATSGVGAKGILAQSIGGSGGIGGVASGGIYTVGGSATNDPFQIAGGNITIDLSGSASVTTSGASAFGILGQSIGGGGGDGGSAAGLGGSVGGSGGAGGGGGTVLATLAGSSSVSTTGNYATGVAMQSIGGGGGNAGNASSTGLFASVALGGTGGGGGGGGAATITTSGGGITTAGSKSPGLLVQSIGGGGGTGGNALAGSVGAGFSVSVGAGGSAGSGNSGGTASATVVGGQISTGQNDFLVHGGTVTNGICGTVQCNALPVDSFGVVVQSIGGGGGVGGTALAQSVAVAVPYDPDGNQFGLAASVGLGGKGGSGGVGGTAQFGLSSGGSITTSGQGSTGVLVQSIGGGGGAGGDSSASAVVVGYGQTVPDGAGSMGVTGNFTMGGSGGGGNNGGQVLVAVGGTIVNGAPQQDAAGSAATSIFTYGDFSNGITAHSIGGGGGNAGTGSGNTQSVGTGSTVSANIGLGSTGGGSGAGGDVTVSMFAGNGITTFGSGSIGIAAQSIGGGGGISQGGSVNVGKTFSVGNVNYEPDLKIGFGTTSAGGGAGGTVNVNVSAPIVTHGGDATGVVAQSIGGGGGIGGSSGADASADNPIIQALEARQGISNVKSTLEKGKVALETTLSLAMGGTGGGGGQGGTVNVNLSEGITTSGDWANGVIAHSIGGGGGKGGTAAASGTGGEPETTVNLDYALGGQGGQGGNGGAVNVSVLVGNTAISTAGYAAAGVIAQSVGAGGGIGADGSDSATGTISLGASTGGAGGVGGNGGPVQFQYGTWGPNNIIATTGTAADGVVLQSVGGGGGIGGAGSSLFARKFAFPGQTLTLSAGGGRYASGDGGAVTLLPLDTGNQLHISTAGDYAFGVLAQSIGGGGGLITAQPSAETRVVTIGGDASGGAGGAVTINAYNLNVATTGVLAHGIVAQSIGGGGGVIREAYPTTGSPSLSTTWTGTPSQAGSGNGGAVTVSLASSDAVNVSGAGAVGILAQSVGGGGGLTLDGNGLFAGSSSTGSGGAGGPVAVSLLVGSTVTASGPQGIGIFAQSTGPGGGAGSTVTIQSGLDPNPTYSLVTGGVGTQATPDQPGASAIQIDGPGGSSIVASYGRITSGLGANGTAIVATGGGSVLVQIDEQASVTGSVYANQPGQVRVGSSATFNAGPAVVAGLVENRGLVNIGGAGAVGATTLTGNYRQLSSGILGVDIDALSARRADLLTITGNADVAGAIVPTATRLLPGTYPVLSAGSLNAGASAPSSLLFDWKTSNDGRTLSLTPNARFAPAGVALASSEASLAGHLNTAWGNSDAFFAPFFGYLSQMGSGSGSSYISALRSLSPEAAHAQATSLLASSGTVLGAALSCPVFVDAGTQ